MGRSDARLIAALLTGLAAVPTAGSASAAVWHWACQGELGDQRILFDREGLYIASGKDAAGKPVKVTADSIQEAIVLVKKDGGFTEFAPDDANGGLESPITFSQTDGEKQEQKVVFTERSSKRISPSTSSPIRSCRRRSTSCAPRGRSSSSSRTRCGTTRTAS